MTGPAGETGVAGATRTAAPTGAGGTDGPGGAGETVDSLAARAAALVEIAGRRVLIGVTGAPGAGKTTFVAALCAAVRRRPGWDAPGLVVPVPMDGFHLADVELDRLGRRDAKGAVDTFDAAGFVALLRRLRATGPGTGAAPETVYAPAFDRDIEQAVAGSIAVGPEARLVVTEGIHLLAPEPAWAAVRPLLDEAWFLDVDPAVRAERLVARHVAFGKAPAAAVAWVAAVDEPNAVRARARRVTADLVVDYDRLRLGP